MSFTVSSVKFWVPPLDQQLFLGLCIYGEGQTQVWTFKCGQYELPQKWFCVWSVLVAVIFVGSGLLKVYHKISRSEPLNISSFSQPPSPRRHQNMQQNKIKKTQMWSCKRGLKPWMLSFDHSIKGKCVVRILTWQLPWHPSCHQLE